MSEYMVHEWATTVVDDKYPKSLSTNTETLPTPPGFKIKEKKVNKKNTSNGSTNNNIKNFQIQKAWEVATQPAKSIPMNLFMSYMSGTSLQIIPIMTALMLLSGPIKAIVTVRKVFKPIRGFGKDSIPERTILGPILIYIVFQLALIGIGLHKLNSMGLFPTTKSDWLSWEAPMKVNETIKAFAF